MSSMSSGTPALEVPPEPGAPTADELALKEWKALLESWEDPGIDPAVDEELQEYMMRRRAEIEAGA